MQKNLLYILLISILIPQFALAAWWNPFSWTVFKKPKSAPMPALKVDVSTTSTSTILVSTTTQADIPQRQASKPVPKKDKISIQKQVATSSHVVTSPYVASATTEQITRITKFCSTSEKVKDLCLSNNTIQLYMSDANFRLVMDQMMDVLEKRRQETEQKILDQYIPSYAQNKAYYIPNINIDLPSSNSVSNTKNPVYDQISNSISDIETIMKQKQQTDFNSDICKKSGGTYLSVSGKCI